MYLKLFVKRFVFKKMFKIAQVFQLEMWITPKSLGSKQHKLHWKPLLPPQTRENVSDRSWK